MPFKNNVFRELYWEVAGGRKMYLCLNCRKVNGCQTWSCTNKFHLEIVKQTADTAVRKPFLRPGHFHSHRSIVNLSFSLVKYFILPVYFRCWDQFARCVTLSYPSGAAVAEYFEGWCRLWVLTIIISVWAAAMWGAAGGVGWVTRPSLAQGLGYSLGHPQVTLISQYDTFHPTFTTSLLYQQSINIYFNNLCSL